MNCRVIMLSAGGEDTVRLQEGSTSIGREADNDIQLTSELVSRHHARLSNLEYVCEIEDLSSSNGTFVNGERISNLSLNDGDSIKIGDVYMRYEATEKESSDDINPAVRDYSPRSGLATVRMTAHPAAEESRPREQGRTDTKPVGRLKSLRPKKQSE